MANKRQNADYHCVHREKIRAKKRDRYATDPEHRTAKKRAVRAFRARMKEARGDFQPAKMMFRISGGEVEGFPIAVVGQFLGRSVNTINRWLALGVIPKTPFNRNGEGYYTTEMIEVLKDVLYSKTKMKHSDIGACRERIAIDWGSIGYFD